MHTRPSLGVRAAAPLAVLGALIALTAAGWWLPGPAPARAQGDPGDVHVLTVDDIVGPISARYLVEAIESAEEDGASALIIELDTPGGLITSMRSIIKAILGSSVPVCVYVAPEGARAASAGAFITISAHVAAMAPGTNIGAASPVNAGGAMDSTLSSKAFNDAEAYIKALAARRGRNEEWAARAVTEAISVTAEEAVEKNVVDFIATSRADLLRRMEGLTVEVAGDTAHVIHVLGAPVVEQEITWRYRVLSILNDPTVAYLLLMLGFYGLFFELSNPGAIFPGVVGGICIILGLMGLQTLSLNYGGLLLLLLAVALFFLETQVASHGVLGLGGTAALFAGSLMLFDSPLPFLRVSMKVIVPTVLLTAAFFGFAITMALRAQRRLTVSGSSALVGHQGEVRRALDPEGSVFVAGEHWTARSETGDPVPVGTRVIVVAVDRLTLTVRPAP